MFKRKEYTGTKQIDKEFYVYNYYMTGKEIVDWVVNNFNRTSLSMRDFAKFQHILSLFNMAIEETINKCKVDFLNEYDVSKLNRKEVKYFDKIKSTKYNNLEAITELYNENNELVTTIVITVQLIHDADIPKCANDTVIDMNNYEPKSRKYKMNSIIDFELLKNMMELDNYEEI